VGPDPARQLSFRVRRIVKGEWVMCPYAHSRSLQVVVVICRSGCLFFDDNQRVADVTPS